MMFIIYRDTNVILTLGFLSLFHYLILILNYHFGLYRHSYNKIIYKNKNNILVLLKPTQISM